MKRRILGGVAVWALLFGTAYAADITLKTQGASVPAAAQNWSGFYVGATLGGSWADPSENYSIFQSAVFGGPPFASIALTSSRSLVSVNGGLQQGYNWQLNNGMLVGIEADFQGSSRHSDTFVTGMSDPVAGVVATIKNDNGPDWFGTVRGRFGGIFGNWVVYETGGLAYGRVIANGSALPSTGANPFTNTPYVWNQSAIHVGWTLGAGAEYAFGSRWTAKIEYLYVDLGSLTSSVSGGLNNCLGAPGLAGCNGPYQREHLARSQQNSPTTLFVLV
jgi:outer membrane immunogenic protein